MSQRRGLTYGEILRFFAPLSVTTSIVVLSHSIVNAGLARAVDAEVGLAAYALAKGFVLLVENPMFMVRQTTVALVRGGRSFRVLMHFMFVLSVGISVLLALLGFTRLGDLLFCRLFGAPPEVASSARLALGILSLLPLATTWRNIYQGVAILRRKTFLLPLSSVIRLIVMSFVVFYLSLTTGFPGAAIGSLAFLIALGVEALAMHFSAGRSGWYRDYSFPPGEEDELTAGTVARFFLPLTVTTTIATLSLSLINAVLARSARPEILLAGYAVGLDLAVLFRGPVRMLHQCPLAFADEGDADSVRIVRWFVAGVGALISIVMAVVFFSPLGKGVFTGVIGVSEEVASPALAVARVFTFLPFVESLREYMWGLLMQRRSTGMIGSAKCLNLAVLVGILSLGRFVPAEHAASLAATAYCLATVVEVLFIVVTGRRLLAAAPLDGEEGARPDAQKP